MHRHTNYIKIKSKGCCILKVLEFLQHLSTERYFQGNETANYKVLVISSTDRFQMWKNIICFLHFTFSKNLNDFMSTLTHNPTI